MNKYDIERGLRHIFAEIDFNLYQILAGEVGQGVDQFEDLAEKFIDIVEGRYE